MEKHLLAIYLLQGKAEFVPKLTHHTMEKDDVEVRLQAFFILEIDGGD